MALAAILTLGPAVAHATVLTGSVTVSSCDTHRYTGFLSTALAGANSTFVGSPKAAGSRIPATFTGAFDAWDVANGDDWTLVNGGSVNVSINAYVGISASPEGAGLSPVLFTLSGGSAQLLSRARTFRAGLPPGQKWLHAADPRGQEQKL